MAPRRSKADAALAASGLITAAITDGDFTDAAFLAELRDLANELWWRAGGPRTGTDLPPFLEEE